MLQGCICGNLEQVTCAARYDALVAKGSRRDLDMSGHHSHQRAGSVAEQLAELYTRFIRLHGAQTSEGNVPLASHTYLNSKSGSA